MIPFDRLALKRALGRRYLAASLLHARWQVAGRSGPRDFSRVKIVAAMASRNGITAGAAFQYHALRRLGIDVEILDATGAARNPFFRIPHEPGSVYIFHSGGPELAPLLCAVATGAADAYRIAYWAWELPAPPRWPDGAGVVSEIWTPSRYAQTGLAKRFRQPIHVVPHFIAPRLARRRAKEGPFTVLALADSRSSFARKNPAGAIAAFVRAFGSSPSARLLVKLNGAAADARSVLEDISDVPNIEVVHRYLDDDGMQALLASADVLLSLHRAEGFGLPMAEAMAHGVPVVATGWSGNTEFMNDANSILVPYRLVPVNDEAVYFRYRDSLWAEPDIDAAAAALRRLATDRAFYDAIASAAHASATAFADAWGVPGYRSAAALTREAMDSP